MSLDIYLFKFSLILTLAKQYEQKVAVHFLSKFDNCSPSASGIWRFVIIMQWCHYICGGEPCGIFLRSIPGPQMRCL